MTLLQGVPDPDFWHASQTTPAIDFLERSSRPEVQPIRETLESWFATYPASEQQRLAKDFRSKNDREHLSAFFELYCHALANASGFDVVPHPRDASGRAKDFRCLSPSMEFELEATLATDSAKAKEQFSNRSQLQDYLDVNAFVPGMRYGIEILEETQSTPPFGILSDRIQAWARTYDRARLRSALEADSSAQMPHKVFAVADWKIEATLWPRPHDEDDAPPGARSIGFGPTTGGWVDNRTPIRSSLKKKVSHYAGRSFPFVLAVNTWFEFESEDDSDFLEALLGAEVIVEINGDATVRRRPDGIWYGPKGPRNGHVSGVLHLRGVMPWSIGNTVPVLYVNGLAAIPLPDRAFPVKTVRWMPNQPLELTEKGEAPWKTFGLWPEWPYQPVVAST